jgi:VanZ family protein
MAAIFVMSTDLLAASETNPWIEALVRFFVPDADPETVARVHGAVRHGGHVGVYALLSLFYSWGLIGRCRVGERWSSRLAAVAILLSAAYAATDEFHQSFTQSRTGTVRDVGWDLLGACLMQVFLGVRAAKSSGR